MCRSCLAEAFSPECLFSTSEVEVQSGGKGRGGKGETGALWPPTARMVVKVPCQRCDKGKLERFLGDEVDGWMCTGAKRFVFGEGCGTLVENAEYRELLAEAQPPPPEPVAPARPPKRPKNDAGAASAGGAEAMDEDGGGGGEEEDDEEWAGSQGFDAIDDQVVDVRVARPMVVRREAACGLLSLSEVDLVLRGAFVAPRGSDARQLRGLLPTCPLCTQLRVDCRSRRARCESGAATTLGALWPPPPQICGHKLTPAARPKPSTWIVQGFLDSFQGRGGRAHPPPPLKQSVAVQPIEALGVLGLVGGRRLMRGAHP